MKYRLIIIIALLAVAVYPVMSKTKAECVKLDSLLQKTNAPEVKAALLYSIFNIQIELGDTNAYNTAVKYSNLAKSQKDEYAIANSYKMFAQFYQSNNRYNEAIDYLFRELDQRKKISDRYGEADAHEKLGEFYRGLTDYNNAIKYTKQALDIYRTLNNDRGMAMSLNRLGAIYNELIDNRNRSTAMDYAHQSLDISIKLNDAGLKANNYTIIGSCLLYFKKYDEAIDVLVKAMELVDQTNEKRDKALIMKNIAYAYYAKKDYKKAIELAQWAYQDALMSKTLVYQWLSSDLLVKIYDEIHLIDSAYKYLNLSGNVKNEINLTESHLVITKAEAQYHQKLYEHELEERRQKEALLKVQYTMILLLIIFVLTAIILRYRKLKIVNASLSVKNDTIEQQKEELGKVNATKDKFFSILAHDLRNPIGNFKMLTSLLKQEYSDFKETERIELIDALHESANSIYELLENLLTWSKSQRGAILMNPSKFNLSSIASDAIRVVRVAADQKQLDIENNINQDLEIIADINMINTVLRNILSNAVKFTREKGEIVIKAVLNDGGVTISIRDNGVGILTDKLLSLFEIDLQHSTKGTMGETGTGLGLVLCSEFVRQHNGRIWVESVVDQGSEFFFYVPQPENN